MSIMFFQKVSAAWKQAKETWKSEPISHPQAGDWDDGAPMSEDMKGHAVMKMAAGAGMLPGPEKLDFDPEEYLRTEFEFNENSKSIPWLMNQIKEGTADIQHAYLFEAKVNGAGKMLKEVDGRKYPYRIKRVFGTEAFKGQIVASNNAMAKLRESVRYQGKLKEDFSNDIWGSAQGPYDPNQYTEYAPLLGGYFYAQMYLTDMLKQQAYAFEAWNHNPLAHRIISGLSQYTLGRRFDWHISKKAKDYDKKAKVWEDFTKNYNIRQRLSKYWCREKLIFGEMFLNVKSWQTLHPATIWEIVTEPTDISNVYYYYRNYPTQYQQFTGFTVPGAPGSKSVPSQKYVIEQIPWPQIIHNKGDCTSFEKRGRSKLFPVLGWLKRIKDLYQAQITRSQMQSDYAWDVMVKGSAQDVAAFQSANSCIPRGTGNTFVHNEAVTRTPMPVTASGGRGGGDATTDNVLAFIATAIGLPKDFFNVIAAGGGNRATALVAAEPFTKVIEDEQADWEFTLHKMVEEVFRQNNLEYDKDDIEFIFPSVTKDTTSEAVANIGIGYQEGYITKQRASEMFAQEMNITNYNYEDEQSALKTEIARGDRELIGLVPSPGGRNGSGDDSGAPNDGGIGDSPIHGTGKVDLQDNLNSI